MPDSSSTKQAAARIFISYSRADSAAADRIVIALKDAGFEAWRDTTNIQPGQNWVKVIDEALTEAGYLLALLSKSALQSQWVEREWTSVLTRQLSSTNAGLVIPLRLEPVDVPTILRSIQSIDLFPNFEEGLRKLVGFLFSETKPAWLVQEQFHISKQVEDLAGTPSLLDAKGKAPTYSQNTWKAWHNALHHESVTDPALKQLDKRTIRRIANRCVTQTELHAFCFDKGIQRGSLSGMSLNDQILSLLDQLLRDEILEEFIRWLAEESPRCLEAAIKAYVVSPKI